MPHLTPTRPPRHLDDDWLYADPLAMGPEGSDDVHDELSKSGQPIGRRRGLRLAHLLGASAAGALLGLLVAVALDLPRAPNAVRTGADLMCPELGDITARFRTDPGLKS